MESRWDFHCHLLEYCLGFLLFRSGQVQWLRQGLSGSLSQKKFVTPGLGQSSFICCLCFKSLWVGPCLRSVGHPGTQFGSTPPFQIFIRGFWRVPYMLQNVHPQSDLCYFCSEFIPSAQENNMELCCGLGKWRVNSICWPISMTTHTQGGLSQGFSFGVYVEARGWSWVSHQPWGVLFCFDFFSEDLSLNLVVTDWLHWLVNKPEGSSCLCLPALRL